MLLRSRDEEKGRTADDDSRGKKDDGAILPTHRLSATMKMEVCKSQELVIGLVLPLTPDPNMVCARTRGVAALRVRHLEPSKTAHRAV